MGYKMKSGIDSSQSVSTRTILRAGVKNNWSTTKIISELASEGLTYRRTNMLRDIRRAQFGETGKAVGSRQRGFDWFDHVFEPFSEKNRMSPKEAIQLWDKIVEESWETMSQSELDMGADMWELYKLEFV